MATTLEEANKQIAELKESLARLQDGGRQFYSAEQNSRETLSGNKKMPISGKPAKHALRMVKDCHELDFKERLNTSSYVNVTFEDEEDQVAKIGYRINLADQTVYTSSFKLHDACVNMVANLWNCPEPSDFAEKGVHAGAQCVGSTEACLLAGLCLKFRWRAWYAKKHGLTEEQVLGVRPNLIISTQFQAAWEKLFKYMDIEPKMMPTSLKTFNIRAEDVKAAVDDKTIGVVCIMGNHYGGQYDPVHEIDAALEEVNKTKGFQVGIHVDGASGGFIAPFQKYLKPWDFRLDNVLSISASGHKFGESICGTGWVVWRQRAGLSEHVAISVSYLGGKGESYTLNFSRPASGVYVQFYKFMRLGVEGYSALEKNMMEVSKFIRAKLKAMNHNGKPVFQALDAGDTGCLPVVTMRLNPDQKFGFDDIDFQHTIAEAHWYVSGYAMSYTHPTTEKKLPLFNDADINATMFRVVVKSNLTMYLAEDLIEAVQTTVNKLVSAQNNQHPFVANKKRKQHHGGHAC